MFRPISFDIKKTINKYGLLKQTEGAQICSVYKEILVKIKNRGAAKNAKPLFFKNKVLTIKVTNSSWAQELMFEQKNIIDLINKKLGKKLVERIQFRI